MLKAKKVLCLGAMLWLPLWAAPAQTTVSPDRIQAITKASANIRQQALAKLPPRLQKALSGGAVNYLQFATAWQNIAQSFGEGPDADARLTGLRDALRGTAVRPQVSSSGPILVSNPGVDFLFSTMAGFTQSETSTAWCGNSVVVGFNDSGSQFETALFGPGGLSFSGAGVSNDGGLSFRDIGSPNPGSNTLNFLSGDPVVSCTDPSTFYYSQIGSSSVIPGDFTTPLSVVFVSKSADGGYSWNEPVEAVAKSGFSHGLDKDWSAVDPNRPGDIYVSYTDFDLTFTTCPTAERIAIEIVHSTNGGNTWSSPTVLDEVCSDAGQFVQGSQIAIDSAGRVYVSWEYFPDGFNTANRVLRIAQSKNKAVSFGPANTITTATATGDGFALAGYFRTFLTGSLTVDRSGGKTDGTLYLTWEDGRLLSRIDLESPTGLYNYANVFISRSTNGGKTWSAPVRVNNDRLQSVDGVGVDHFQPGVAVDASGTVAACWYDRRNDPLNYRVARYCGTSTNQGATWTNAQVSSGSWSPVHATDAFINLTYLGDYDTVASDITKMSTGFQGAFGNVSFRAPVPNQDTLLVHLSK